MKNYKNLKSGTDIRGVASDIFGKQVTLTAKSVEDITYGFVKFLEKKLGKPSDKFTVALGHDSRITADAISNSVKSVLCDCGVTVLDCGLASTPAMFMSTIHTDADASIQITASHHPADRNGLKFFLPSGGLDSPDISEIIDYAEKPREIAKCEKGEIKKTDFMSTYSAILRKIICDGLGKAEKEKPLSGFHIVVDAGNGAGGFYAENVLSALGADTSGSVCLEPDGMFPNHIPNPENEEAMQSIRNAVLSSKADLGVIFDTDVDRAGCVDSRGDEINRNRLIALSAAIVTETDPGATIVTDSVTSSGLKVFIEKTLGGHHHRFKRGYKNVINEAIRLCEGGINAPLAIETSGHAALKENYFLDDGAYLVTKIIIKTVKLKKEGRTIDDLISELKEPAASKELRFAIIPEDFKKTGNGIIDAIEKYGVEHGWNIADDNREGIRVSIGSGWFLLRLSVHDPIMPLNIEADNPSDMALIAKSVFEAVKPFEKELDLSPITEYIESFK